MVPPSRLVQLATLLLLGLIPRTSQAYCWSSTCQPDGVVCEEPSSLDCGTPLYWQQECVGFSIQRDGTSLLSLEDARWAVSTGFHMWVESICEGKRPGIGLIEMMDVTCDKTEYNSSAGNANVVIFRDVQWPYPESPDKIALTTVTFNPNTGHIYDVDMEVNSAQYLFTVTPTTEFFDLVAIMTHEAGHFFGMGHSPHWDSTMFELYEPGTTSQRVLSMDDFRGMCAMYPPWPINRDFCNPIPRHGFSTQCASDQSQGCALGIPSKTTGWVTLALCLTALGAQRKRRCKTK